MQFNEIKKLFYCNSCFSIDNNIIPPLPTTVFEKSVKKISNLICLQILMLIFGVKIQIYLL